MRVPEAADHRFRAISGTRSLVFELIFTTLRGLRRRNRLSESGTRIGRLSVETPRARGFQSRRLFAPVERESVLSPS